MRPGRSEKRRPRTFWEKQILGVQIQQIHMLGPGLAVAGLLGWLSILISRYIGQTLLGFERTPVSAVMIAILLGLAVSNSFNLPRWMKPGFTFSVKKLLKLGIIFLGIRLSILEVLRLGLIGIPIVAGCIIGALIITTRLNKWLKLPRRLGTLIAVGTSICGVSAIVATGPAIKAQDEEVTYAISVITIFGILATVVYPYLAKIVFAADPVKVGLFLGTAIHDTSQVAGAGLVYSETYLEPRALSVATITKLVRNIFMVGVIPLMAFLNARSEYGKAGSRRGEKRVRVGQLLPYFIIGFIIFAAFRSVGDVSLNARGLAFGLFQEDTWASIYSIIKELAVNLLVVALAAVGLNTRIRNLKGLGVKPFLVGFAAACSVGGISYLLITLMVRFMNVPY